MKSIGSFLSNQISAIKDIYNKLIISNNFLSNIITNIKSFINLFTNKIKEIIDFFTQKYSEMITFFTGKFQDLFDFFTDVIEFIREIIQSLLDLPGILIEKLQELLKSLFVPGDDFFSSQFDSLLYDLENKLEYKSYLSLLESIKSINVSDFADIEVEIMGVRGKILDGSVVTKSIRSLHSFIRGAMFIFLLFFNYRMVLFLVRGTAFSKVGD